MNDTTKNIVESLTTMLENQQVASVHNEESIPYLVLRQDQRVHDIEKLMPYPARKRGIFCFTRAESFCRYVNEQKIPATRIFATDGKFIAVLDFHEQADDGPSWMEHRAVYTPALSQEWLLWTGNDKKQMSQREFSQFLEDNLDHIDRNTTTDLVEMVRHFEANSSVEFRSSELAENGNYSLSFVQTTQTKAGQKGAVELPRGFTLIIPAYEGGSPLPLQARLRFSINEGKLRLWYELHRAKQVLQQHTEDTVQFIATQTEIPPFYGTPA